MDPKTTRTADPPICKTRVLVVDDHEVVRVGIAARLGIEPDLEVCGEAATAAETLQQIAILQPDVVLLDLSLSDGSGLDVIKRLRLAGHTVRILVVSRHEEALYAERCVRAGAQGFLAKTAAVDELVAAVRRVRDGQHYFSAALAAKILAHLRVGSRASRSGPLASLSDRELEVYEAIAGGLSIKQIATRYCLSPKTIDAYRASLKRKLGLDSTQELSRHAMQWLLEQPPRTPCGESSDAVSHPCA